MLAVVLFRCQELEAKTFKQDTELKEVNEMLLLAACQKFKLQQEIQAWEVSKASHPFQYTCTIIFFSLHN